MSSLQKDEKTVVERKADSKTIEPTTAPSPGDGTAVERKADSKKIDLTKALSPVQEVKDTIPDQLRGSWHEHTYEAIIEQINKEALKQCGGKGRLGEGGLSAVSKGELRTKVVKVVKEDKKEDKSVATVVTHVPLALLSAFGQNAQDAREGQLRSARLFADIGFTSPFVAQNLYVDQKGSERAAVRALGSLADFLKQAHEDLDATNVKRIFGSILLGLEDLHQAGLVHRDIKPENILIFQQNGRYYAQIADFDSLERAGKKGSLRLGASSFISRGISHTYISDPEKFRSINQKKHDVYTLHSIVTRFYEFFNTKIGFAHQYHESKEDKEVQGMLESLAALLPGKGAYGEEPYDLSPDAQNAIRDTPTLDALKGNEVFGSNDEQRKEFFEQLRGEAQALQNQYVGGYRLQARLQDPGEAFNLLPGGMKRLYDLFQVYKKQFDFIRHQFERQRDNEGVDPGLGHALIALSRTKKQFQKECAEFSSRGNWGKPGKALVRQMLKWVNDCEEEPGVAFFIQQHVNALQEQKKQPAPLLRLFEHKADEPQFEAKVKPEAQALFAASVRRLSRIASALKDEKPNQKSILPQELSNNLLVVFEACVQKNVSASTQEGFLFKPLSDFLKPVLDQLDKNAFLAKNPSKDIKDFNASKDLKAFTDLEQHLEDLGVNLGLCDMFMWLKYKATTFGSKNPVTDAFKENLIGFAQRLPKKTSANSAILSAMRSWTEEQLHLTTSVSKGNSSFFTGSSHTEKSKSPDLPRSFPFPHH